MNEKIVRGIPMRKPAAEATRTHRSASSEGLRMRTARVIAPAAPMPGTATKTPTYSGGRYFQVQALNSPGCEEERVAQER